MSDLFGGLGGLMKGLSGFMPQDDPDVKVMTAQTELNELQKEEAEIYAEVGRQILAKAVGQFPEQENRLQLIQVRRMDAEKKLKMAEAEKQEKDSAKQAEAEALTCPSCGHYNSEGVKFCQECGSKLGALKCSGCGAKLISGTRFCGECGKKQGD